MEVEEKFRTSRDLLSDRGFGNAHARISIRPPTLTGHSCVALGAMMMKSSSFESPKPNLFALKLKDAMTFGGDASASESEVRGKCVSAMCLVRFAS